MNGERLAETPHCLQPDSEPTLRTWVIALRGNERQCHGDDVMEEDANAVVDDQQLPAPRLRAVTDAHLARVEVVGVLYDLDQPVERLDAQLLGAHLSSGQDLP